MSYKMNPQFTKLIEQVRGNNPDPQKWHIDLSKVFLRDIQNEALDAATCAGPDDIDDEDYNNLVMLAICKEQEMTFPDEMKHHVKDVRHHFAMLALASFDGNKFVTGLKRTYVETGRVMKNPPFLQVENQVVPFRLGKDTAFGREDMNRFNRWIVTTIRSQPPGKPNTKVILDEAGFEELDGTDMAALSQYITVAEGMQEFLKSDTPGIAKLNQDLEDGKVVTPGQVWQVYQDDQRPVDLVPGNKNDVVIQEDIVQPAKQEVSASVNPDPAKRTRSPGL